MTLDIEGRYQWFWPHWSLGSAVFRILEINPNIIMDVISTCRVVDAGGKAL